MKAFLLFICLSSSLTLQAQTRELKTFNFQDTEITYSRIDYSRFGVIQIFVNMYSEDDSYDEIEQSAYSCLLKKGLVYHTLYYFIRVPNSITDLKAKNRLFSEFVNHLKKEEQLNTFNLYLNFDQDYSKDYQLSQHTIEEYKVKRVTVNISNKTICKNLSVR